MDDRVVLHLDAVVKHLLPDNVAWKQILLKFWAIAGHLVPPTVVGGVRADDVEQLLDVDRLQLVVVVCHVPLLHEVGNVGVALPNKQKLHED